MKIDPFSLRNIMRTRSFCQAKSNKENNGSVSDLPKDGHQDFWGYAPRLHSMRSISTISGSSSMGHRCQIRALDQR